jgi:hypothetical protein
VSRDARIPALDELGIELEQALLSRRRRHWWRLHPAILALVAGAALAVPAGATWIDWARLVEGETALPTQAPARVLLASGSPHTAEAWRFVVYKARLAEGGRMGLCAYLVGRDHGAGGCAPSTAAPALLVSGGDGGVPDVIAGLVSERVARVELTLSDRRSLVVAPQAPDRVGRCRARRPRGAGHGPGRHARAAALGDRARVHHRPSRRRHAGGGRGRGDTRRRARAAVPGPGAHRCRPAVGSAGRAAAAV